MPKKKADVESDEDVELDSEEEEDLHVSKAARTNASTRPRRATAGNKAAAITKKLLADEEDEEEDEDEDEMPEIPKAALAKYKESINAPAGTIHVIRKADMDPAMLKALLVARWPVWESATGGWPDVNKPYEYEHTKRELSLFLEGSCTVTPTGGEPVQFGPGDFAVFPKKLGCTWTIIEPIRKHYYEFAR